ncbi:hypothetical protein Tco_1351628 [Tanacetum coccineum]
MGDEHLSTIPKTESDELIMSSDETLVPIPSESEDITGVTKSEGAIILLPLPEFETFMLIIRFGINQPMIGGKTIPRSEVLLLPEIETGFTIQGYALKSNPRDFLLLFPPIAPDFEPSRAHGFVLRSLELQSSASFGNPISKSYQLTFIFEHT